MQGCISVASIPRRQRFPIDAESKNLGTVEVDETFLSGPNFRRGGRGAANK